MVEIMNLRIIIMFVLILAVTPTITSAITASVELYGEKTDVELGENIILKLSSVNLITKPVMTVQVILIPPSGMPVTSSEFVLSGAEQYTTTYKLEPGSVKDIEIMIKTSQAGDFIVKGRIIYYFGIDQSTTEDHTLELPIKVREFLNPSTPTVTATPSITHTITPTPTPTPSATIPSVTTPVPTQGMFRVGPTVTLRSVTDVIETNQDGIVDLFMNNPSLNDARLNVDIRISVPSGMHVYGESFSQAAGAGVAYGTFSLPPGTTRTIAVVIKADKSARIGSHTISFTGLYWPGDNKDNYQPLSLTYSVNLKKPSEEPDNPPETPIPTYTITPTITPTVSPSPIATSNLEQEVKELRERLNKTEEKQSQQESRISWLDMLFKIFYNQYLKISKATAN
jgi:hypothetical protein